jgi:predicted nucleic-acid-binding protein
MTAVAEDIFADTNLFLRYLTNDVPAQAEAFEGILRQAAKGEFTFVTTNLVMAEIVWTLESYYGLSKAVVQNHILAILNTPGLMVAEGDLTLQAILWYKEKNVDFIDAYHAAWMLAHGIKTACSFDRKHFSRFEGLMNRVPGGS